MVVYNDDNLIKVNHMLSGNIGTDIPVSERFYNSRDNISGKTIELLHDTIENNLSYFTVDRNLATLKYLIDEPNTLHNHRKLFDQDVRSMHALKNKRLNKHIEFLNHLDDYFLTITNLKAL